MSKTTLAQAVSAAPSTLSIHVPIGVFLTEAIDLAKFVTEHWQPVKSGKATSLPGLSSVAHKKTAAYAVSEHTPEEITELVEEARKAQTNFHLAQNPRLSREDLDRAARVVSELEAALEFLFDDGKEDANDAKLASIEQAHAHDATIADQAQALDDYAALAKAHKKELDGLGDFDVALIDEAPALATKLRARDAASTPSPAATAAMENRNRVLNVLDERVTAARAAARFVFRNHADVQRRATSAYERRKRAASRRAAAAAKSKTATPPA